MRAIKERKRKWELLKEKKEENKKLKERIKKLEEENRILKGEEIEYVNESENEISDNDILNESVWSHLSISPKNI